VRGAGRGLVDFGRELVDCGEGGALEEGAAVYGVDVAGHEAGGVAGQEQGAAEVEGEAGELAGAELLELELG
jgi:hypothetical protein